MILTRPSETLLAEWDNEVCPLRARPERSEGDGEVTVCLVFAVANVAMHLQRMCSTLNCSVV